MSAVARSGLREPSPSLVVRTFQAPRVRACFLEDRNCHQCSTVPFGMKSHLLIHIRMSSKEHPSQLANCGYLFGVKLISEDHSSQFNPSIVHPKEN